MSEDFETFLEKNKIDLTSLKEAGKVDEYYDPERARLSAINKALAAKAVFNEAQQFHRELNMKSAIMSNTMNECRVLCDTDE